MSSGFSGGAPDYFAAGGRSATSSSFDSNFNPRQQFAIRPPLYGIPPESPARIRRPDLIGKRSLVDYQQPNQNQLGLGFYLRNVKARPNYLHTSSPISPLPSVDFSPVPSVSLEVSTISESVNPRYGIPTFLENRVLHPANTASKNGNTGTCMSGSESEVLGMESEKKMMNHRLQELEKALLAEDAEEAISVVSSSELSDTIQDLIGPTRPPVSPSPTSSSSSCSSTSASPPSPCVKQSFIDAATAISDGKSEAATEILTRLQQIANPRGTSEQRLTAYMLSALKSRVKATANPSPPAELYSKEQTLSIHTLYDVSPCFRLGFMAANLAILEAASERDFRQIHVLDFDIGQGRQYVHLLHALASKNSDGKRGAMLKVTAFDDFSSFTEEKMKIIQGLKARATKIGVCFDFSAKKSNISDINRENLGIGTDETLAVNLAFKLHKLPDESVTTENLRDELLRRVKSLSPAVVTLVEQDLNANTAPLTVRVRETYEHYGALFDSLEATLPRDNPDRVRIESALGRKIGNSVACEGGDRVERCEVHGKWRARMRMAGFELVPIGQPVAESLRVKLISGTRGVPGYTVSEQSGGIGFGWMGRILTVASAWR